MPQIKASTILGQFLIDNKPYQCGAYKPHYADGDTPKFGVKSNEDNYRIYTPDTLTYDLEVLSSNANDSNSVAIADAGVKTVTVDYLDNDMYTKESGEWGTARGNITLRTSSGSTIEAPWNGTQTLAYIAQGGNKDMTAIYTVPADKELFVHALSVSSANQDQSIRLRANVNPNNRELVGINTFLFQSVAFIGSNANSLANMNNKKFPPKADIKVSVLPNAGSADTSCHLEFTEMSI